MLTILLLIYQTKNVAGIDKETVLRIRCKISTKFARSNNAAETLGKLA